MDFTKQEGLQEDESEAPTVQADTKNKKILFKKSASVRVALFKDGKEDLVVPGVSGDDEDQKKPLSKKKKSKNWPFASRGSSSQQAPSEDGSEGKVVVRKRGGAHGGAHGSQGSRGDGSVQGSSGGKPRAGSELHKSKSDLDDLAHI